jgi:hypothetical protein
MLSHLVAFSSDLRPLSINISLPGKIFPNSILVRRRRHAMLLHRGRYSMPKQKLRICSDTACRASVRRRWVRQPLVVYLTHLWYLRRFGKPGVVGLHGYGCGGDVVRRSVCSRSGKVFVVTTVSASSWRRLDPDDSFLFAP